MTSAAKASQASAASPLSSTKQSSSSSNILPTLRDPQYGWLHFVALGYALVANTVGLALLFQSTVNDDNNGNNNNNYNNNNYNSSSNNHSNSSSSSSSSFVFVTLLIAGLVLSTHGRIVASYLVHDAAHASIFLTPWANRWCGKVSLVLAGCPYADFAHVKRMHLAHHEDRADTVEFDYRTALTSHAMVRYMVLAGEYCFVPMVETIMHTRTALYPILYPNQVTTSRYNSALLGTPVLLAFYVGLWKVGGLVLVGWQLFVGALVLQYLCLNDAFHHTYLAIFLENYTPGPGPRTAAYEEENTFSNLISLRYPWLNLLSLNFGYHNAHHQKAIVPWYQLPALHEELYGNGGGSKTGHSGNMNENGGTPQVLPYREILWAWYTHRLRRVVDEDYGVVKPPSHPHRAKDFVGSLGVSFLTV